MSLTCSSRSPKPLRRGGATVFPRRTSPETRGATVVRGVSPAAVRDVSPVNAPLPDFLAVTGSLDDPGRVSYKTSDTTSHWPRRSIAWLIENPQAATWGFSYACMKPGPRPLCNNPVRALNNHQVRLQLTTFTVSRPYGQGYQKLPSDCCL